MGLFGRQICKGCVQNKFLKFKYWNFSCVSIFIIIPFVSMILGQNLTSEQNCALEA